MQQVGLRMTDAQSTYEAKLQLLREYQVEQLTGAWQQCSVALQYSGAGNDEAANVAMNRMVILLAEATKTAIEIAKRKAAEAGDGR